MDLEHARELLTAELGDLDRRTDFAAETRAAVVESDDDLSVGTHPADRGTEVAASMDAELLLETVADQRRGITEALRRLDDGRYGKCLVCDREIDDERLDARPEAATCREHADTPVAS